jgi:hypothetical protein
VKGVRKLRTEDGYIVRRVLNGEPEAFGLLVDRYKASIYAFAYVKLRNFHDAEDVAKEVFIKAYQKLRELRRGDGAVCRSPYLISKPRDPAGTTALWMKQSKPLPQQKGL